MMEIMSLQKYNFQYDKQATSIAYGNINNYCVEQCSCSYCENFNVSRNEIYTPEFLKLLSKMGIDYQREAEVYHIKAYDNNLHLYGGWFHFIGRLTHTVVQSNNRIKEAVRFGDNLKVFITEQTILVDTAFNDKPVLQLEFRVVTPWMI